MKRVLLGLGSNKSFEGKNPLEILNFARTELEKVLSNVIFSSVYRTKAMYVEDQEDFYNMAAIGFVQDNVNAFDFLKTVNRIEAKYGRDRDKEIRFGPRSLDIDIELFGNEKINEPDLQIPHIRMEERAFVLIPALEIISDNDSEKEKYTECLKKLKMAGQADGVLKLN